MTPQELEMEQEHSREHLSTADLAQAANRPTATPQAGREETNAPLFAPPDTQDFRSRWEKIQIGFVDEPRKAVEQADELVATAIKRLAEVFANEPRSWKQNGIRTITYPRRTCA